MKKKLNLLWNLKFNFFSVAERPLTFFAYFLNAKKVGRRRLVISPAKAGAFLFSHTRLPLSPRPLLPFGRISPAAKPGWPVIGPAFWVCRAKAGTAFRCAKPPCAVVRFAAMASPPRTAILPFPSRLRRAGSPTAKPRRLLPFGRISLRETAQLVIGPTGADVLAGGPRLSKAKAGQAKTSALLVFNPVFSAQKPAQPPVFGRRGVDKVRKYHFVCVVLSSAPLTLSPLYAPARPVFRNRPKEKAAAENRCGCEHAIYEL